MVISSLSVGHEKPEPQQRFVRRGGQLLHHQRTLLAIPASSEFFLLLKLRLSYLPFQVDKHNTSVSFVSIWTTGADLQTDAALYSERMRLNKELENIKSHLDYHCDMNCLFVRETTDHNILM